MRQQFSGWPLDGRVLLTASVLDFGFGDAALGAVLGTVEMA